jgi:hypothetical protein
MDNQLTVKPKKPNDRKKLLRDVLVFQGKLALDGIRDIILSPVAMIAAIYGAITHPNNPSVYFQSLMQFGRKTDDFINLFEHRNYSENVSDTPKSDDYVEQVEAVINKQLEKENVFFTRKKPSEGNEDISPEQANKPDN